jgi:hypothetical protein
MYRKQRNLTQVARFDIDVRRRQCGSEARARVDLHSQVSCGGAVANSMGAKSQLLFEVPKETIVLALLSRCSSDDSSQFPKPSKEALAVTPLATEQQILLADQQIILFV